MRNREKRQKGALCCEQDAFGWRISFTRVNQITDVEAIHAVARGKKFLSCSLEGHGFIDNP